MISKAAAAAATAPPFDNLRSSMEVGLDLNFSTPEVFV
jgi:hypothetical protein